MLSIFPMVGVGLCLLISSMNSIPGSPVAHAALVILSKMSFAGMVWTVFFVRGLMRWYCLFFRTASMKSSVSATEMLKLVRVVGFVLLVMKLMMSGWSVRSMAMFAPLCLPPCFITSVVVSYMLRKLRGPDACPFVLLIVSPAGLIVLKLKPVPPPVLWMMAIFSSVSNML